MSKVENIQDSKIIKKFKCEIELDEINQKAELELESISKTAEIKGFRKGHAPMKLIKEIYFNKAYNQATDSLMRELIEGIIKEGDLKLAASPSVNIDENEKEKIVFEVMLELVPEITNDFDYSKIKVETFDVEIAEESLQNELEMVAKKNREFKTKEGKAEKGDVVVIDTIGRSNGVEFAGGKLEGHELELGSGSFIPGFEDQLINSSAGEDIVVNVTFPDEYHAKDLAGKDASFYTKVKEVKAPGEAKIDDELAKKLSYENLEALKKDIMEKIVNFYSSSHKEKLKDEIFKLISEALDFEVSENMVNKVAVSITQEKKLPEEEAKNFIEEAEKRLRLSLFLNHIASEQKITISDQEFANFIIQSASQSGSNPFAMLQFYEKNKNAKRNIMILLEENKIYDFIFNQINPQKKKITQEEFDKILDIKR